MEMMIGIKFMKCITTSKRKPDGWTKNGIAPGGHTLEDLRDELLKMLEATEKEILDYKEAIEFHRWMMKNDTIENADKYFHWSDEDMFNEFLKQTTDINLRPIDYHNQPETEKWSETNNTTFIMDEELLDKRMKVIGQNGNTGEHYE